MDNQSESKEEKPKCGLCGEPMPEGEEMFKFHGYSGDCPKPPLKKMVDSAGDDRTANNVMRHEYRVLGDDEKLAMKTIKDKGLEFHEYLEKTFPVGSRELSLAKTKIEEAVMWAVKHITK